MNDVNKACSCPSGDGSLRHPCPAHSPLADNQQGCRVRLGDARARFEVWAAENCTSLSSVPDPWTVWQAAVSASQSVNGLSWADYWMELGQSDVAHDFDAFSRAEAWALQRFHDARQPVRKLTDAEIDARLNTLYRELVASGQHNGGMSGVAWDRAVYRMASNQPTGNSGQLAVDGARQPVGEPITVEAVAEIFNHPEYGLSINWLLENGIGELQVGDVLLMSDRAITDEDGSGEVYTAPPAPAVDLGEFLPAVRMLVVSARTSGGTAGRDVHLCGALDRVEALLPNVDSQAVGK